MKLCHINPSGSVFLRHSLDCIEGVKRNVGYYLMLQAANAHLQDQLYAAQQRQQLPNTVDARALKKRLEDVTQALLAYRVTDCNI